MIGQEGIHAYDALHLRHRRDLAGGIALIPALVGAFGFAEMLTVDAERRPPSAVDAVDDRCCRSSRDVCQYWRTIIRSGVIGTFIGILPGRRRGHRRLDVLCRGASRASKEKEQFGKGSIEGLMAAETGDNAGVPGAIIPVLTLAIPGSAPAAVLMAAMIIHGVQPGPMIMIETRTSSTTWWR